jgi:hypothetical protein
MIWPWSFGIFFAITWIQWKSFFLMYFDFLQQVWDSSLPLGCKPTIMIESYCCNQNYKNSRLIFYIIACLKFWVHYCIYLFTPTIRSQWSQNWLARRSYIIGMCHCVDFMVGKELSLVNPSCSVDNDDFSHLWMALSALWHIWRCMFFVKTLEQQYISNTWHFNYDQAKKLRLVMIQCGPPKKPICIGEPISIGLLLIWLGVSLVEALWWQ